MMALPPALPEVRRPVTGRIRVKMPYDPANTSANPRWLKGHLGARIQVQHVGGGSWAINRDHLRRVVVGLAERFGHVHVHLDYLEHRKCDTRCVKALGDDCVCQCGGENHGGADYQRDWQLVGETTLVGTDPPVRTRHVIVYCNDVF